MVLTSTRLDPRGILQIIGMTFLTYSAGIFVIVSSSVAAQLSAITPIVPTGTGGTGPHLSSVLASFSQNAVAGAEGRGCKDLLWILHA